VAIPLDVLTGRERRWLDETVPRVVGQQRWRRPAPDESPIHREQQRLHVGRLETLGEERHESGDAELALDAIGNRRHSVPVGGWGVGGKRKLRYLFAPGQPPAR